MATIKDIAKILVSRHKLKVTDAEMFLQSMVEVINEGLMEDRQVKIKGFGTFKLQAIKERASVNVNTGEKVVIGEHDKITFTPDNLIKEIINKPFAQFDTVIINDETAVLLENMPDEDLASTEETTEIPTPAETVIPTEIPTPAEVAVETETPAEVPTETPNETVIPAEKEQPIEKPSTGEVPTTDIPAEEVPATEIPTEDVPTMESPSEEVPTTEIPSEETPAVSETPVTKIASITAKEPGEPVELIADSVRVVADTVEVVADKVKLQTADGSESVIPAPLTTSADSENTENETDDTKISYIPETSETPSTVESYEQAIQEPESVNDDADVSDPDDDIETNSNINENENRMYSLLKYAVVAAVFFVLGFFAGTVDWKDFLNEKVNRNTVVDNAVVKHEVDSALLAAHAQANEEATEEAQESKDDEQQKQKSEATKPAEKEAEQKTPAATTPAEQKTEPAKTAPAAVQKDDAEKDQPMTQYNKDPRVKYGAYYIIGTDQTVTVKEGQTLKSISRAFLGPDMECYVEAINGVKEVKAGQKLKIPKLKMKKIKK